jgi:hypothetical protein
MRSILWLALSSILVASAADAAPPRKGKGPVRKAPAKAASRMPPKPVAPLPPTTAGIMVPKSVVLVRATPAETRAHAVWTLRAALNVAALQCQYSPFLRTVDNYNQMLKKHGSELISAQTTMLSHYARTVKRGGAAAFDRYNTRSYNSFSTLDAQYNFCWAAGQAGLALRVGDVGAMGRIAEAMVPELRAALAYVPPAAGLNVPPLPPLPDVQLDLADLTEN